MTRIYVDADACPVKQEIYRVADRHSLRVTLVANSRLTTPLNDRVESVVVRGDLDAADDWIAERAGPGDIVITADIPLAARCLERGAAALAPTGKAFSEDGIGDALATRELLADLREAGVVTGGPSAFRKQDRSRFLQELEEQVRRARRLRPT
ncbi:MAG: YaiI/YqxD family protein [Acidobacteriota bacterium]